MAKTLDIVIVNWNSGKQLLDCLNSIPHALSDSFQLSHVFVIDNASSDSSLQDIDTLSLPLTLICNKENKGFAYGCNQGGTKSTADYVLFLNPDTRLYTNSLSVPLLFIEQPENKDIGILGVQLIDEHGHVARSCARFPTTFQNIVKMFGLEQFFKSHFMQEWDHSSNKEVDQVMGAFFLVRRDVYEHLHGFDERFFVYFEEVDFALRAKKCGWRSFYLADAQIFHRGGGTSQQVKAKRLYYYLRSRMLYSFKNFNYFSALTLLIATLSLEPFSRCALALAKGSFSQAKETCQAYGMLYKNILSILRRIKN